MLHYSNQKDERAKPVHLKTKQCSIGDEEKIGNKITFILLLQVQTVNPLPALTYQNVLDLNVACRAKRT
jgi:hypothetical protein